MATVSIIVPAYNAAQTLPGTLQSVLEQSYQDFDIWVVDDGSTDETQQLVQAMTDPRIHLLSQANAGAAAARNLGIEASDGEILAFLDADDCWIPEKLADQVTALHENPAAAVAYSWTDYIDLEDQFLYVGGRKQHRGDVYGPLFRHNFIESGSNLIVRRAAVEDVGGFDASLRAVEDWELWLRLAAKYEFALVPKAQVLYRVCPESNSSDLAFQERTLRRVLEQAVARSPQRLQPYRSQSLSNLYQYLTFRCLSLGQTRQQYLQGLRYLLLSWLHEPQLLVQRTRLMAIATAKFAAGLILSPERLSKRKSIS